MDPEISRCVNALRESSRRFETQIEDIAQAIQRISQVQQSYDTEPGSASEHFPSLSPMIRDIRSRHASRPVHESSRIPGGGGANPNLSMQSGLTSMASRPISNRSMPSEMARRGRTFTRPPPRLGVNSRPRPPFGGQQGQGVNFSPSTLASAGMGSGSSPDDCPEGCDTFSVSPCEDSTLAEGRFAMEPQSESCRSGTPTSGSSGQSPLSFRNQSDLVKALICWWSSFLLEKMNPDSSSERDSFATESELRSLSTIVNQGMELFQHSGPTDQSGTRLTGSSRPTSGNSGPPRFER